MSAVLRISACLYIMTLLGIALSLWLTPIRAAAPHTVDDKSYSRVIHVDCDKGSNNKSCGSCKLPCKSLALATKALENNTLISIPGSTECPLNEVVNISGFSNVGIAGNADLTLICNGQNGALYVALVTDLQLTNITFRRCGAVFDSASINASSSVPAMDKFHAAVYIINVTNLALQYARFEFSMGMGLAVYNTNGNVYITNCLFNNSVPQTDTSGGGGMLLHYSYCTPGLIRCDLSSNTRNSDSNITIEMCLFVSNLASNRGSATLSVFRKELKSYTFALGKGGGMNIIFAGNSSRNFVILRNLTFYDNSAQFGGAVNFVLKDNASNNNISIVGSLMRGNKATADGGALRIAMEFYGCAYCVTNNLVLINDTQFISNSAVWGGAVEFFSSRRDTSAYTNNVVFYNCLWDSNTADIAAAVDIAPDAVEAIYPGFLPVPVFEKCTFVNNILRTSRSGILNIQSYEVQFKSYIKFEGNLGTALYITDATVVILNDTQVNFTNNTRTTVGGGMALIGSSVLHIHPGTHLNFNNNVAQEFGGAIYYSSINPSLLYSYTCFIEYVDGAVNLTNVKISFANNLALGAGHAIYASTLIPCAKAYGNGTTTDEKLQSLFTRQPFIYQDPYIHKLIATAPHRLGFTGEIPLAVAPAQPFQTGIKAYDELNQTVNAVFHTIITNGSEYASINSVYSYTSESTLELAGIPHHPIQLSVQTAGLKLGLDITLTDCPPGFYNKINETYNNRSQCMCSADVLKHQYDGIFRCDSGVDLKAILTQGYWAGCLPVPGHVFVTGQCPLGFCNQTSNVVLPHTCENVSALLCRLRNRTGILCGNCLETYTVHYHSKRYKCSKCKYPDLGLLFYALTELLPLTLVFVVIVVFGVSFTSGPANSFIFFAQVLNFFDVTSLGSFPFPRAIISLTDVYQFIFGAFNFDFFNVDIFSFCLWKNAQILDVFVFKYVTTVYAITLLLIFVLAVKYIPRCYSCLQRCVFRHAITSSLVQGICALLIISYAQCAKVSFQILTPQTLRRSGLHPEKKVVFLSGKTDYFSKDHLPYAVPALSVLLLTIIPPAVLILHPTITKHCGERSCFKLNQENEQHNKLTQWKSRLTPFFDAFQGCFKDNCRYFAGLYFIYRLAISMAFALADNGMELYFTLEVILIVMLASHAIIQPYQHPFFNIVDTAIFADLALINGLSIYVFYWAQFMVNRTVAIASSIQAALIYLPLLYMAVMVILKVTVRFERVRRLHWIIRLNHYIPLFSNQPQDYERLALSTSFDENHLPPRLFDEDDTNRPLLPGTYGAVASSRVTL